MYTATVLNIYLSLKLETLFTPCWGDLTAIMILCLLMVAEVALIQVQYKGSWVLNRDLCFLVVQVKVAQEEAQVHARKNLEAEEEVRRARENAVRSEEERMAMERKVQLVENAMHAQMKYEIHVCTNYVSISF